MTLVVVIQCLTFVSVPIKYEIVMTQFFISDDKLATVKNFLFSSLKEGMQRLQIYVA